MRALLTFAMVLLPSTLPAAEAWRTVTVYDGLVSLEIPAEWNEISPELLDFFAIRAAETSGGRSAETYQHGFRPARSDVGFELPQVLIQIRESGRIPYGRFLRLPSAADVEASDDGAAAADRGPFVRDMHVDGLAFDADRKRLLIDSTLDLSIEGLTAVRTASYLTERGMFIVHCYDHAAVMDHNLEVFDRIIGSVEMAEEIRYRPRWLDRWSSRSSAIVLFVLAAAAGLVALLGHRRNLRRSGRGASRPEA